ncbi:MAG: sialidase family protein [Candidatus Latescibacterota bacterium]
MNFLKPAKQLSKQAGLLVWCLLMFQAGFSYSQTGQWLNHGLSDKKITAIAKDVSIWDSPLYVVADSTEIYRWKRSDGRGWIKRNSNLPYGIICALEAMGDSCIFTGMDSGRVFRSKDAGFSWEQVFEYPSEITGEERKVTDLAAPETIPPWDDDRSLYALVRDAQSLFGEVLLSDDLGESWREITGSLDVPVLCMGVASVIDWENGITTDEIFVGTIDSSDGQGGIYKSLDGGGTWVRLENYPEAGCNKIAIGSYYSSFGMESDAKAIYTTDADDDLFVSLDEGETWTPIRISDVELLAADKGDGSFYTYSKGKIFLGGGGMKYGDILVEYGIEPPATVFSMFAGQNVYGEDFSASGFEFYYEWEFYLGTDNGLFWLENIIVDVEHSEAEDLSVPLSHSLSQNHPNPFNGSTVIEYTVAEKEGRLSRVIYHSLKYVS